ncbi:MAG TPA: tetratricopeptide repeat protein, partial [Gemmataceae bacterium]|nr:tetratricopeptide repeat protein [Gemmataceae bacterium]
ARPDEIPGARRRALEVLAEAERLSGPRAILEQERQAHQRALGLPPAETVPLLVARTVWERNALGRFFLRAGQIERAEKELRQACALEPHNPWANHYYGLCAYRLKRFEDAALAFSVCIGATPKLAGCYYSRALALTALGRITVAVRDYDYALQLDATLAVAWVNRGMLHYQESRYDQALADLAEGLVQGANPELVYYDEALVYVARHEPRAAQICLERALQYNPHHEEAMRLRATLRQERRP